MLIAIRSLLVQKFNPLALEETQQNAPEHPNGHPPQTHLCQGRGEGWESCENQWRTVPTAATATAVVVVLIGILFVSRRSQEDVAAGDAIINEITRQDDLSFLLVWRLGLRALRHDFMQCQNSTFWGKKGK